MNKLPRVQPIISIFIAFTAWSLSPPVKGAEPSTVAIPLAEPMKPNPVAPQLKLNERRGRVGKIDRTGYEYVPASYIEDQSIGIQLPAGIARFTTGSTKMLFNGSETELYSPTLRIDGDSMISLNAVASAVLHKKVGMRKDVYRNDIYYVSDRAADLSAQTIAYIDEHITGKP